MSGRIDSEAVAVVVVRDGRLPAGADEVVAEAGGAVLLVGTGVGRDGAAGLVASLGGVERAWWAEAPFSPAGLAGALAPVLEGVRLAVLPASPDGRDLAPRLAATLGRPLLAGVVRAELDGGTTKADLLRADGRIVVPVTCSSPAVVTLWPGSRGALPVAGQAPKVETVELAEGGVSASGGRPASAAPGAVVESLGLVEPDPATMDLADAPRVVAGGAGLVPTGADDAQATAIFTLLSEVAAALGASAGATRVVTDAGWMGYDRQIGTTGVTLDPELYLALGISGASQHIGGIGDPQRVLSVNLDPSCPMTGLADLGLVVDAPALLVELAGRLGVPIPAEVEEVVKR